MEKTELYALLERYFDGTLNAQQGQALLQAMERDEAGVLALFNEFMDELSLGARPADRAQMTICLQKVLSVDKTFREPDVHRPIGHRVYFLRTGWFRYVAAIIVLVGSVAYLWLTNKKTGQAPANDNKPLQAAIEPGNNKAVLTLSDGSTIILDSAANGKLAQQGNAQVIKLSNGEIAYSLKEAAVEKAAFMNTMSTPRGGQYQLVLPDGSRVWLNAASSITYPAVFVGKERKVKITGEAYLEVMKNKARPFIVDVDGKSSIEVVGTSFNVNSYADETTIKTTLIEGSVKIKTGDKEALLKPGQQAAVIHNGRAVSITDNIDIDRALAWKNGLFNFDNADLQVMMRQLARWYDIEVRYEGIVPKTNFGGKFSRDVQLSDVLIWFSKLGIQNRLEGRTLILSTNKSLNRRLGTDQPQG